jgi:protein-disulfide isomerase
MRGYTSVMTMSRAFGVAAIVALAACSTAAQPARQPAPSDVVATVGSASITLAEVDELALREAAGSFGSMTLAQALYEARRAALDEIVGNQLLDQEARAQGVARTELVKREIGSRVSNPTDADVAAWYRENPTRVQGALLEQVREPIRELLTAERTTTARRQYLDVLAAKTSVKVALEPPRLTVAEAGRPARGPADAPIHIVEFSDFQCPFCLRANPTIARVLATYGDRIRFVYRHYPLPNHPDARPAAEASACAAEQDKFWPYHDRLFANPSKLTATDLKQHAAELGLDVTKFNACVDTRKYQKEVDADIAAAETVGVTGTPAFFINGRALSGAQPFEAFKRIIDEELASKAR